MFNIRKTSSFIVFYVLKNTTKPLIAQNAIVFCDMYLQRLILGRAA